MNKIMYTRVYEYVRIVKDFIAQGYTMAEKALVETTTDISFEYLDIDNECMADNLLEKIYKQEPTYMVFDNEKMIKDSITYEALIELIASI